MTKNAQQALRYLLQEYSSSVRFCLICNYISRIDDGLQNEFLKLRFNQLPEKDIHDFLMNIAIKENLNISENIIISIQKLYKSDIRSMINYMQTNQDVFNKDFKIINNDLLENIFLKIKEKIKIKEMLNYIRNVSIDYNIDNKNIIKYLINYIIRNKKVYIQSELLNFIEDIMHNQNCNIAHYTGYVFTKLSDLINKID
jgi:DNA polymerase III delta prime subunit